LTSFALEKNVFIATSAAIDFGVDLSRSIVYVNQGYVQGRDWWYLPGLVIIAFAGSYVGKLVLNKVPQEIFRKIVLFFVFATGLVMIIKALSV
ncbi:MAG: sulfite exporter TauE/SafE family protein, partial [Chitinophagaceae bacterium]|nr:sulfite exporter TauE/SafE family protein [Chitinophagaceae bacterium]